MIHIKNCCYALVVLVVFVLNSCKSEDELPVDEGPFTISFYKDSDTNETFNSGETLYNGGEVFFELYNGKGDYGDYDDIESLDIKNISNSNANITIDGPFIVFKTNATSDQKVIFDLYHNGKEIATLEVTIKVPYKLLQNGQEVSGDLILNFENPNVSKAFKLVNSDGTDIESFEFRRLFFNNPDTNDNNNIGVLEGKEKDFKLFFKNYSNYKESMHVMLFYSVEELDFKSVFIKDVIINVEAPSAEGCQVITDTDSVSYIDIDETYVNYEYEYLVSADRLLEFKDTKRSDRDKVVFYSGDKIDAVYEKSSADVVLQYSYEGERLKRVEEYGYLDELLYAIDYYYNTSDQLTTKVKKVYDNDVTLTKKDSIVYSDFANNYPSKRVEFNFDYIENITKTVYFKSEYDSSGHITKEDISLNDVDYVTKFEASYSDTDYTMAYFSRETGAFLVKQPIILSQHFYADDDAVVIAPVMKTLKELKKDDLGNITSIEYAYFEDGREIRFLNVYAFTESNCY